MAARRRRLPLQQCTRATLRVTDNDGLTTNRKCLISGNLARVYMPYQKGPDSIYGYTMFCLVLERSAGTDNVWKYTDRRVCIKISSKFKIEEVRRRTGGLHEDPETEVLIMQELQANGEHPHLNTMLEAMEDRESLYVVLDFCDEELFAVIAGQGNFDEAQALQIFGDMLAGVAYMHQLGMAHLDISLENTMIKGGRAVVIDFGMAHRIPDPDSKQGFYGKLYYMHPQMFRHRTNRGHALRGAWSMVEADIWSLGVCLFTMMIGGPPWENPCPNLDARFKKITGGGLSYVLERWGITGLSPDCVDFLQKILSLDSDVGRLTTIEGILQHPWMQRHLEAMSRRSEVPVLTGAAAAVAHASSSNSTVAAPPPPPATRHNNSTMDASPPPPPLPTHSTERREQDEVNVAMYLSARSGQDVIPQAPTTTQGEQSAAAFSRSTDEAERGPMAMSTAAVGAPAARRALTATTGDAWRSQEISQRVVAGERTGSDDRAEGSGMDIC